MFLKVIKQSNNMKVEVYYEQIFKLPNVFNIRQMTTC
jgi:hypothetical protein